MNVRWRANGLLMAFALVLALPSGRLAADEPAPAEQFPSEQRADERFTDALQDIRELAASGRHAHGLDELRELLADHGPKGYVLARRVEIHDLAEGLAFGADHRRPRAEDVITGELLQYNPRSGRAKLRYTPKTMGDFTLAEGMYQFPAAMAGSFRLALSGERYPSLPHRTPLFVFGQERSEDGVLHAYIAVFGSRGMTEVLPSRLVHTHDDAQEVLWEGDTEIPEGAWTAAVEVTRTTLKMVLDGQTLVREAKAPVFGAFAVAGSQWDVLEIEGVLERSWIQARIDERTREDRSAFRATYDASTLLPPWLCNGPHTQDDAPDPSWATWPGEVSAAQELALFAARLQLTTGAFEEVRVRMEGLRERGLAPAIASYFDAAALLGLGRLEEAATEVNLALEQAPDFRRAQLLRCTIQTLRGLDEICDPPKEVLPAPDAEYEFLAMLSLLAGRPHDLGTVARLAARHGARSESLDVLTRALIHVERGPDWTSRFEHRSPHYRVVSNIDAATSANAARTLEEALKVFSAQVPAARENDARPFAVYLFAGRAGFDAYLEQLGPFCAPGHANVAGIYSPFLRQLLIWNLPSRDQMLATVRHEGFHQYFDRIAQSAPVWFEEGLAVYYEIAEGFGGALRTGLPHHDHLETLDRLGLIPMTEFLALEPAAFYAQAPHSYAQAWALIHMLRHGEERHRRLFDTLLRRLQTNPASLVADELLDPDDLDTALGAHLGGLGRDD